MVSGGVILLGQVAERTAHLDVSCRRCERTGRLSVARLVRDHGAGFPMPELRRVVASDCPRWDVASLSDLCGVQFPQLPALFGKGIG